jgi:hypothetical protein
MDLNYLYQRRGISLMRAASAACEPSRSAHLGLAQGYNVRIKARRPILSIKVGVTA